MEKKRYTIGFLFGDFYGAYTANLFFHIVRACREDDQNMVGFGGGFLKSPQGSVLGENCNFIFDLVNKENVDGLIVEGSIGNFIPKDEMRRFLRKYPALPIVNIGTNVEGVSNILIDNKKGMEALVTHLIDYHGYRKIAFIAGTEGNYDAIQRFEAYRGVLHGHGIALDDRLVTDGNFSYFGGVKAYETLFEERKVDCEAVVCANDYMAISAMREMQKRGMHVPNAAAVTGFDDTEECWTTKPTLTTVKQPFYEIGRESVKLLVSLMETPQEPKNVILPTEFVIRESCGCRAVDKLNHIKSAGLRERPSSRADDASGQIGEILSELRSELPFLYTKINVTQSVTALVDAYRETRAAGDGTLLYETFLSIFRALMESNEEILNVYKLISVFYGSVLARVTNGTERERAAALWNDTAILFGLLIKEDQSEKRANLKLESHVVLDINENFINTFNIKNLKETVLANLPHFQFKSFFVCLFEDHDRDKARILIAYDKDQRGKYHQGVFPSRSVLPSGMKSADRLEYVVMALNFKDESFGYIVYDIQTLSCFIYETLSVQISGAIKGARLTNELYGYTTLLETKVKERTSKLEDANEKLKKLDELKNDFIANITHDFRSPLTVILNVSDLALKFDAGLSEENRDNFDMIYKASLRLKSSIDRLLELAKMDAHGITLKVKEVGLVSFMNKVLDFYSSSVVGSGIRIIRELPDGEVENFCTDREKLQEILDNIISNAVKFVNPDSGIITCELKDLEDRVQIHVSDNGIGIPKSKLETIFNRFEQAHVGRNSPYRGTGIGLAFAKQLVGYLHGRIWAESEGERKGSRFVVELRKGRDCFDEKDFTEEETEQVRPADSRVLIQSEIGAKIDEERIAAHITELNAEDELDYKKGIILVIDDDKNVRDIILKYLRNNGFMNFIIASDGRYGLEAAYEYSPDLILCDYNMPNMKGDELHNQLIDNPKFRETPFLFLSAIADEDLIIERREKGANAYLKKPIDEKLLIITVEENLKKYFDYVKVSRLATIDELTGLHNKRAILADLKHVLSMRRYRDVSVLFIDVDHFKEINDAFGHQTGDSVLSEVGRIIKATLRNYDIPGRYGGDEFIVILPDTSLEQACRVAEKLRKGIENAGFRHPNGEIGLSGSLGAASLKDNAEWIEKTLEIRSLESIYEVQDLTEADWNEIESLKMRIAEALLKMADVSLSRAKQTTCGSCSFSSEKAHLFPNDLCPQCGGTALVKGKNKVVAFS
jgi:diguanylate cyclase (GGDEF)-like protein